MEINLSINPYLISRFLVKLKISNSYQGLDHDKLSQLDLDFALEFRFDQNSA